MVAIASAQVGYPPTGPGGYPPTGPGGYPPGYPSPYPGGSRVPGQGPGVPRPRGGGKDSKTSNKKEPQALPNFRGTLKQMDAKSITLELGDYRVLEFKVTGKTRYMKNGEEVKSPKFTPGDQLSIEASEEPGGFFNAVNVYWEKAASAGSTETKDGVTDTWKDAPAQPTTERTPPPAPRAADDPGPPKLQRGKPAGEKTTANPGAAEPPQTASTLPVPAVELPKASAPPPARADDQALPASQDEDPLIRRASEAALEFTESLPNYVCQEMMSRSESDSKPANWRPLDVVSVEVVYEAGKENYRNVTINGKAVNKNIDQLSGAWSTGEFGSVLIDLFSPATAAEFHFRRDSRIAGLNAKMYDYKVQRENSHWTLHFGAQTYEPAYSGSVWIDPQTARVLRIEMQAGELPKEFPADHIESATDYQYVRLGGTQQFLLPVHAETLSCQRGSAFCSRNTIDFRNYHKYSGESTVEFGNVK